MGINHTGKNLAVSTATQTFKKVTGNLLSTLGTDLGFSRSPINDTQSFYGKRATEMYQFPTDVDVAGGVGSQGHYVMFNINQQDHAKMKFRGEGGGVGPRGYGKTGRSNMEEAAKQYAINSRPVVYSDLADGTQQETINGVDKYIQDGYKTGGSGPQGRFGTTRKYKVSSQFQAAKANSERAGTGMYMVRAPTTRLKTAITLFMPASVSTTYGATYTDTQIGSGAALALDVYDQIATGAQVDFMDLLDKAGVALSDTLLKGFLATVGALPELGGVREAAEARAGVVISDRMELAFKGTAKRVFSYTFKMIPKSNREALAIRNIVKAFKFNMLPEFKDSNITGRRLTVPNTFDISYMYVGKQNEYLHKIGTCVLENMNVQYGGDRYRTFDPDTTGSPPPVETSLTLNFKELEMMTRERVEQGH